MLVQLLRSVRNFAAFIAGLMIASVALQAYAPFPKVGSLNQKFHHLKQNREEYSLIYVGSSRVYHEFIATQFDARLAERNHPVKSLNFGQDGMWPPESLHMVREVLSTKPKNLRWVFIDLMPIKPMPPGSETSMRAVSWHDTRHTWMALRNIVNDPLFGPRTVGEKVEAALMHSRLWIQRSMNAGTGSDRLHVKLRLQRAKRIEELKDQGWEEGAAGPLQGPMREEFFSELEKLRRTPPKPIPPVTRDALNSIAAEVRAAGAEPIFVVASNFFGRERFTDWPPPGVTVFSFDDPEKFPQLYDPDHRCDVHHLDPVAAVEFTRLLADRFADYLEHQR